MATYLDGILDAHRRNASRDDRSFVELRDLAESVPSPASLRAALEKPGLSVIAEFKRRSPSKGLLNETIDLSKMVLDYVEGGASAMNCLNSLDCSEESLCIAFSSLGNSADALMKAIP